MVPPPGPPNPIGGAQSVSPAIILRSNSGMLRVPSLLAPPRSHFKDVDNAFGGNVSNVTASLLNQSFPDGFSNPFVDTAAEVDLQSVVGDEMSFGSPKSSSFAQSGRDRLLPDEQHSLQLEPQNFQHILQQPAQQFSAPPYAQQQHQQQQFHSIRGIGPVKFEPQVNNDQFRQQQQQKQLPELKNLTQVKLEPQQIHTMRTPQPVKPELQHADQPLYLQQQQQQQQLLHISRQSSPAAAAQMNLLHNQRLLQLQQQQHQQQQFLKAMPQQRPQLPQQFQQQNMHIRSPVKPAYEPGMCAKRVTHYMYQQQHRPDDNNIDFWRKFVAEYFAPNAKKKWCVSMYGSSRQTTGVFPQDTWHCEICNRKPGRGFEATAEVLPRLLKIKFESGTLEELLYVDMPREYHNSTGQIVLDYAKAIQESVFEQLRVVRDGQLRVVFSPDLKICSWEFCARHHEELIPRRLLISQVSQLGVVAQKYQSFTQNATSNLSVPELQNNCNMFVASARTLAKTLEVPLVNDLGYTKRYVRCLQISEVVNYMKDLIDYSRETGTGPMDSLAKLARRTSVSSGHHGQAQPSDDKLQQQHTVTHNSNADQNSVQTAAAQVASSIGVTNVNNCVNSSSASTTTSAIAGLLHQNSMNSRQQNSMNNASSPYGGGSSCQISSPGSSSTVPQAEPNPQTSHPSIASANHMSMANSPANIPLQQHPSLSGEADPGDAQSSVQKIIHEMMASKANGTGGMVGAGSPGNDVKNGNGILPTSTNTGNGFVGNGTVNGNTGVGVGGCYGTTDLGPSGMAKRMRPAAGNNSVINRRVGMASIARDQAMNHHHQGLSSQLLTGLEAVNGFNNLQFDWKPSP